MQMQASIQLPTHGKQLDRKELETFLAKTPASAALKVDTRIIEADRPGDVRGIEVKLVAVWQD